MLADCGLDQGRKEGCQGLDSCGKDDRMKVVQFHLFNCCTNYDQLHLLKRLLFNTLYDELFSCSIVQCVIVTCWTAFLFNSIFQFVQLFHVQ